MATKKLNWNRIIANAGLTFFTSLVGFTGAFGASPEVFLGALFTAFIQGGVAGFTQMREECDDDAPKKRGVAVKAKKILATALIF